MLVLNDVDCPEDGEIGVVMLFLEAISGQH